MMVFPPSLPVVVVVVVVAVLVADFLFVDVVVDDYFV